MGRDHLRPLALAFRHVDDEPVHAPEHPTVEQRRALLGRIYRPLIVVKRVRTRGVGIRANERDWD